MVEFALAAPLAFLLLLGLVVVGITVTHQIQLNQAVKNSARALAICGVAAEQNPYNSPAGTLPNGNPCTNGNVQAFISGQLDGVASGLGGQDTVTVYDTSGVATVWTSTELADPCSSGEIVQVSIKYPQPLYVPLVGYALGNGTTDTMQLSADGEATC
ncbi:MAG: TadE/TadG family type IV pilus assembly protein [Candidatus Dormiibacterota bacterium]